MRSRWKNKKWDEICKKNVFLFIYAMQRER